jgi:hypothetical protein
VVRISVGASSRVTVSIRVGARLLTADLSAKSVRKAHAAVSEHGAEGVVAMLQGKLVEGDVLAEAGLTVQPKGVPKSPQALTATE